MGVGPVKGVLGSSGTVTKARYANMKFGDSKTIYMIWPFEEKKQHFIEASKNGGPTSKKWLKPTKNIGFDQHLSESIGYYMVL